MWPIGEELKQMGLNVPQITDVFLKLKASGVDCRTDIFTVEDGVKEINRLFSEKKGVQAL